jgi:hypothetical protein
LVGRKEEPFLLEVGEESCRLEARVELLLQA